MLQNPVKKAYRDRFFVRYDGSDLIRYFTHSDFPGLQAEPYSFTTSRGDLLWGNFYSYPHPHPDCLVVFEHGLGGGHLSYMREIEVLCRHGYKVFAYDHTGCMSSGGAGLYGLSNSLRDLDECLHVLENDPAVAACRVCVVGHSFGGFAALNISAYHPDLCAVVALSGYTSVRAMLRSSLRGPLGLLLGTVLRMEEGENLGYAMADALKTLPESMAPGLFIYSKDDTVVSVRQYHALQKALAGLDRYTLLLEEQKGHNPNYTKAAAAKLAALPSLLAEGEALTEAAARAAFRDRVDWWAMTEQDEAVWQRIFAFLDQASTI